MLYQKDRKLCGIIVPAVSGVSSLIATWLVAVGCVTTCACVSLHAVQPAKRGEYPQMRQAMRQDALAGRLNSGALDKLARVTAEKHLREASETDAIRRISQVLSCAAELEDVLMERAERNDKAAPLAAMALLDQNRGKPNRWRSHITSTNPDWRAVAVRTLTDSADSSERQKAMLDPSQQVRYAAVKASEQASLKGLGENERALLLDVIRLDPFDSVRVTATRAIGWSATLQDLQLMRELWANAPEAVRQTMVAVWSFPNTLEIGGNRLVQWVSESSVSMASVVAGGILVRLGGPWKGSGLAALYRGITEGTGSVQKLAIGMAPLSEAMFLQQVQKLGQSEEPEIRIAAVRKLATYNTTRKQALQVLGQIAISNEPYAIDARSAMASLGDRRVLKLLLEQAKSDDKRLRMGAMQGFLAVGDAQRASFFLADPDANVRMTTACRLLRR